MTAREILETWFQYSNFDPNQTRFNMNSITYEANRLNKRLITMLSYDPTGTVSVICAKEFFLQYCKNIKTDILSLLENPDAYQEEHRLYSIFTSPDVTQVETNLLNNIDAIVQRVIPTGMIGERDVAQERKTLLESVSGITSELQTCRWELYCLGEPTIQPVANFATKILPFHTLADCLIHMTAAPDGMYLCYIDCDESINGWFGFFIKQGQTLMSVNDRVDEAFPGQHARSRNNRWLEEKKYSLFPYSYVCNFTGSDYLGYATQQTLDDDKCEFFKLGAEAYMPLVLAMALLINRLVQEDLSKLPIVYTANLLPQNRCLPDDEHALIPIDDKALAAVYDSISIGFTSADIIAGNPSQHTDKYPESICKIPGNSCDSANLFTSMYANGFELDAKGILSHQLALPGKEPEETSEIIGTKDKLQAIAYMQSRAQLADYIRQKQVEQYIADGLDSRDPNNYRSKADNVYLNAAVKNVKALYQLCVQKYRALQENREQNVANNNCIDISGNPLAFIAFEETKTPNVRCSLNHIMAGMKQNAPVLCPITGSRASVFFYFRPQNYAQLEMICGKDVLPKSFVGWENQGHQTYGNPLLEVTDPVTSIGSILEDHERNRNIHAWTDSDFDHHNFLHSDDKITPPKVHLKYSTYFYPYFSIGFSKRGFAKLLKAAEEQEQNRGD